jgi:hypothetical protein
MIAEAHMCNIDGIASRNTAAMHECDTNAYKFDYYMWGNTVYTRGVSGGAEGYGIYGITV